jgi:DNA-binding NtrC family response regulator
MQAESYGITIVEKTELVMDETSSAINVLIVSPYEPDLILLSNLISHSAWSCRSARTMDEARSILTTSDLHVVLCEADIPGGGWESVLDHASSTRSKPELIVLARNPDEKLWATVLNLGAWDLLPKPVHGRDLYRTVHHAFRHWSEKSRLSRKPIASEEHVRSATASPRSELTLAAGR